MSESEEIIKELEKDLENLKKENSNKVKIKQLKKQIKGHQFMQTKTGRFIDVVGGFGSKVGKKLLAHKPQVKGNKKRKHININEIIKNLPA